MPQIAATEGNLWTGGMGVKGERSCLRALVIWYHHISGIVEPQGGAKQKRGSGLSPHIFLGTFLEATHFPLDTHSIRRPVWR